MFFQNRKKRFVYQDDHISPEYIFHKQYPINCLLNLSKAFKKAVDQINKLLCWYGNFVSDTILDSYEAFRLRDILLFPLNFKMLSGTMELISFNDYVPHHSYPTQYSWLILQNLLNINLQFTTKYTIYNIPLLNHVSLPVAFTVG